MCTHVTVSRAGLSNSGSKVVVCDPSIFRRLGPHLAQLNIHVILARAEPYTLYPKGVVAYADVLKAGMGKPCELEPRQPDDIAIIMYTSGSTGHPKGVAQTHRGVTTQLELGIGLVR